MVDRSKYNGKLKWPSVDKRVENGTKLEIFRENVTVVYMKAKLQEH